MYSRSRYSDQEESKHKGR